MTHKTCRIASQCDVFSFWTDCSQMSFLLRPVYYSSSRAARTSSATMLCPACRNQYSLRKGTIIPAILLTSAILQSDSSQAAKFGESKSANCSPVFHRRSGLVSPQVASPVLGHTSSFKSPHRMCRPMNLTIAGSQSFNMKDTSPTR